ncbi:glycosyltransferase [Parabacteroides sp. TM07-1AC]|jgi:hypothetical protein|uniref:glycosyltransferase n=1 Tax=Parabacteroides sp. TM07-1AC TaxID=2292363 RepID=UPI0011C46686|nr:glycosyltransferase [Parabacteroides sp. TM07-1AC]
MNIPKILIVSNQCLSKCTSNGRSLGSLLQGWPKCKIAQFCLNLEFPDLDLCDNYFCITDKDAVDSLFYNISTYNELKVKSDVQKSNKPTRSKNSLLMLVREFIWRTNQWKKFGFNKWVNNFNPDIVLLQSGDSAFMLQIARIISQNRKIPLLIYNTEGYYFFKKPWIRKHWLDFIFFPIIRTLYRREFRKLIASASASLYLNCELRNDYDAEFGTFSDVIYTGSNFEFKPKVFNSTKPSFCYLGNLGLNRYKALIEIADALNAINPTYSLDVYGNLRPGTEHVFDDVAAISYHGLISYDEVQKVIRNSDILFHAEVNEEQWQEALRYGFSTKIADSISSGHNFMLYAPQNISCSKYIIASGAAWYVSEKKDLEPTLRTLMTDSSAREAVLSKAKEVASINHNASRNAEKFQNWIRKYYNESK